MISWDIDERTDRERYYWPQEAVRRWWEQGWDWERLEATLRELDEEGDGRLLQDSPASQAAFGRRDVARERDLEAALGDWLTPFGRDEDEKPLRWDPFHLPLFDPTTGELSPKHPDYEGEECWSTDTVGLFAEVLLERMKAGMASGVRTPLQGVVLPPEMDLSVPEGEDGPKDTAPLSADLSYALIGPDFTIMRRLFIKRTAKGQGEIQSFAAQNALFGNGANFELAGFGDQADFRDAGFGDNAGFRRVGFGNGAVLQGARFGEGADFGAVRFGDGVAFETAQFGNGAVFRSARFGDSADFENVRFGDAAAFEFARFGAEACFRGARFGDGAIFRSARFGAGAVFRGAEFGKGAVFRNARFGRRANFDFAELTGSVWRGVDLRRASLEDAVLKDADFTRAQIWLDGQDIRDARFGPNSANPWMSIIRNATGSALFFNALFLLAFFGPLVARMLGYYMLGVAQESGLIAALTETATEPESVAEPATGTFAKWCSQCRESVVWKEVLGGTGAPWLMGMSVFLVAYNLNRYLFTRRAARLYDEQKRSGHAPRRNQYRHLIVQERSFRLLIIAAMIVSMWNFFRWLMEPIWIYGGA